MWWIHEARKFAQFSWHYNDTASISPCLPCTQLTEFFTLFRFTAQSVTVCYGFLSMNVVFFFIPLTNLVFFLAYIFDLWPVCTRIGYIIRMQYRQSFIEAQSASLPPSVSRPQPPGLTFFRSLICHSFTRNSRFDSAFERNTLYTVQILPVCALQLCITVQPLLFFFVPTLIVAQPEKFRTVHFLASIFIHNLNGWVYLQ